MRFLYTRLFEKSKERIEYLDDRPQTPFYFFMYLFASYMHD